MVAQLRSTRLWLNVVAFSHFSFPSLCYKLTKLVHTMKHRGMALIIPKPHILTGKQLELIFAAVHLQPLPYKPRLPILMAICFSCAGILWKGVFEIPKSRGKRKEKVTGCYFSSVSKVGRRRAHISISYGQVIHLWSPPALFIVKLEDVNEFFFAVSSLIQQIHPKIGMSRPIHPTEIIANWTRKQEYNSSLQLCLK